MSMSNTMINTGLLPMNLDGRRPTAPGIETDAHWAEMYAKARQLYIRHSPYWSSDQWLSEYKNAPSYRSDATKPGYMDAIWDLYQECIDRERRVASVSRAREKLSHQLGPREFTLTYSPAWYTDDASAQDAMRVAIDKLTRYYKHDIIEFHAIGEYTEAKRAHVHCYYELDGGHKITDKNFKRAWEHWNPRKKLGSGHQGGHHANVRSKSDFLGYIEKDLETAWMNVHITKNADDDTTEKRNRDQAELQESRRSDDEEASG